MKYEDVQKLRTKYRQDPEVINVEYMRDVAVRCGNFKKALKRGAMKEALIAGAAVFLLSYLFITTLIKISRAIDRYKMKKKIDKIKVGQRYEYKGYFMDLFERGKHVIKILEIKEGFALYEYEKSPSLLFSMNLEDIVEKYILITDIE